MPKGNGNKGFMVYVRSEADRDGLRTLARKRNSSMVQLFEDIATGRLILTDKEKAPEPTIEDQEERIRHTVCQAASKILNECGGSTAALSQVQALLGTLQETAQTG